MPPVNALFTSTPAFTSVVLSDVIRCPHTDSAFFVVCVESNRSVCTCNSADEVCTASLPSIDILCTGGKPIDGTGGFEVS